MKVAIIGLGKMGLSHLSILGAHAEAKIVGVCDSTAYLLDVLRKNTSMPVFSDYKKMILSTSPDAVIISTPNSQHFSMAKYAIEQGAHVFCEKPLTLSAAESEELQVLAAKKELVSQVGYHNRFVGSFAEVKRLLGMGALGRVSHVLAEAYGPVVLQPKGSTWRNKRVEGGGCLFDYAAHPLDLIEWYFGEAHRVRGSVLRPIFSTETEDEVLSTLSLPDEVTAQLSVSWSDESVRKMTTRISIWGEHGKVFADRQEIQVYFRSEANIPEGYDEGQNVKYTTELTPSVDFYLRGEEYTAQLDHFLEAVLNSIRGNDYETISDFGSAARTDKVIGRIINDAADLGVFDPEEVQSYSRDPENRPGWKRFARKRMNSSGVTALKGRG